VAVKKKPAKKKIPPVLDSEITRMYKELERRMKTVGRTYGYKITAQVKFFIMDE
jgi:hypothetical protein